MSIKRKMQDKEVKLQSNRNLVILQIVTPNKAKIEIKPLRVTTEQVSRKILYNAYFKGIAEQDIIDDVNNNFGGSWLKYIKSKTNLKWCYKRDGWHGVLD